jgi:preprotein translocase subunit SecY
LSKANATASSLGGLGKYTELRQRLMFVVLALIVYRIGCYIPVPGVDPDKLRALMDTQKGTIVDMFNMFSGGALHQFSLFALNVVPYISASIVVQLMGQIYAPWKAMRAEGESGRRKLTQYARVGAVVLAIVQSFFLSQGLQAKGIAYDQGVGFLLTSVVALTTGTMFLMWLGEQITERGVGNGVSLIIFAGIVAGLPSATWATLGQVQSGDISILVVFVIIALVFGVTYFVVFMERGLRKITVNYARRQGGRQGYMNQSSHLPLKLNMAGVIPPIFASSLILFPATISSWLSTSTGAVAEGWRGTLFRGLQTVSQALAPAEPLHMLLYGAMIIGFAFFYTALVFNSQETADNLKKSGALIPGIRPGKATGEYIDAVLTRLTLIGALYLVLVCLTPEVLRNWANVPFYFGGTSLLIVVVVVMDFTAQIQAHLMSHQYEGLMRKANLKGGSRGGLARG